MQNSRGNNYRWNTHKYLQDEKLKNELVMGTADKLDHKQVCQWLVDQRWYQEGCWSHISRIMYHNCHAPLYHDIAMWATPTTTSSTIILRINLSTFVSKWPIQTLYLPNTVYRVFLCIKESLKCSGFDLKFCFNINPSRNQRTNVVFKSTVEEAGRGGGSHDKEPLSI